MYQHSNDRHDPPIHVSPRVLLRVPERLCQDFWIQTLVTRVAGAGALVQSAWTVQVFAFALSSPLVFVRQALGLLLGCGLIFSLAEHGHSSRPSPASPAHSSLLRRPSAILGKTPSRLHPASPDARSLLRSPHQNTRKALLLCSQLIRHPMVLTRLRSLQKTASRRSRNPAVLAPHPPRRRTRSASRSQRA